MVSLHVLQFRLQIPVPKDLFPWDTVPAVFGLGRFYFQGDDMYSNSQLNNLRKDFLRLNKMPFCLPAAYDCSGIFVCVSLEFFSPFIQISIREADHGAFFFPSRRVASTEFIVFMYVNRF